MSDVWVIGCGKMGSALIETLRDEENEVTIRNRTREKAERLSGDGVSVADSVREALEASPTTLVSITSYEASHSLLEGARHALEGRTLVQLSSGLPEAARDLSQLVTEAGGSYVDASILAYPSQIGTDTLVILYSGDREAFEGVRPTLEQLGGAAMHVGEDPGGAAVREAAVLVPYTTMAVGLWQGAKLCELEDVSLDWFADFVQQSFPPLIDDTLRKAKNSEYAMNPDKAEGTLRQGEFYTVELVEYLDELGIDSGMLAAVHRLCEVALEEGRGDHGMAYLAEVQAEDPG